MRKAGIMLKKVDNSQLGYYATKSANWIAEKATNVDVVMFVKPKEKRGRNLESQSHGYFT